ncbi:type II secretion system major pseudopilin GspG [Pontiella sp.]|uniref:type II secretion system major pseudopilin GspG n=1 Tax=Pontiella sp. TaxID=2837462 RepID=UPI003566D180
MNGKQKNHMNRRKGGFTLIEILLVVVIIGILAGIGIPALSGKSEQAKIAQAQANIKTLESALAIYEMNNGAYPSSLDGLLDSSKQGFPFLDKQSVPKDPWGNPFSYSAPGSHNSYKFDISCTTPGGKTVGNWDE